MAEDEPVESMIAEKATEELLLKKVYNGDAAQLKRDTDEEEAKGAINHLSALKRVLIAKSRKELPDLTDVSGYLLQRYQLQENPTKDDSQSQRSRPRWSFYLATKQGIRTIHCDDPRVELPSPTDRKISIKTFGDPQVWTGLRQVENVLTGNVSLNVVKGKTDFAPSTPEKIGARLWSLTQPITKMQDGTRVWNIKDGQGLWQAYVAAVFQVGIFENNKLVGQEPVLAGGGKANLRVGLIEGVDKKTGRVERSRTFVQLTSEDQVRALLRDMYDEDLLGQPNATQELSRALVGTPVYVFGSGQTPKNPNLTAQQRERMKEPKIQMRNGNGIVVPYQHESS
jgi:hypothetical protein